MKRHTDFLVIGSGIAGLIFAINASKYGKVTVLAKEKVENTTTAKAQGGIASVTYDPDSFQNHAKDTISSGSGLNDKEIVDIVVKEGPERIKELISYGTKFDKNKKGLFDLGKEGGHTQNRVLHYKDKTGEEIQRALLKEAQKHHNIEILENHFTIEIITQHHLGQVITKNTPNVTCFGAYVFDKCNNKVISFISKKTIMATGGCGTVYSFSTNPEFCTGDGVAMVYRAKGLIKNMEFIQFHPTVLYDPDSKPGFLITEALRGAGAILRNDKGEDFCKKYDPRGSLAPRDIVARAIDNELKITGNDFVLLDATHIPESRLKEKFPTIYEKCLDKGIDICKDMIPVIPGAHYMIGGIKVNKNGESTIKNLYAIGEVACTNLHGANRLASNSLLEAAVFAHRASINSGEKLKSLNKEIIKQIPDWDDKGTVENEELVLVTYSKKEVQQIMSTYVGIVRSDLRLKRALDRLEILYKETEALYKKSNVSVSICELRNLINVAYLIVKMGSEQKQNIGLHFNIDLLEKKAPIV